MLVKTFDQSQRIWDSWSLTLTVPVLCAIVFTSEGQQVHACVMWMTETSKPKLAVSSWSTILLGGLLLCVCVAELCRVLAEWVMLQRQSVTAPTATARSLCSCMLTPRSAQSTLMHTGYPPNAEQTWRVCVCVWVTLNRGTTQFLH